MKLRSYQQAAIDAVLSQYDAGTRSTLILLPTGTGKTVCFAHAADHHSKGGKRIMVIAHRAELLTQAANKIKAMTGSTCEIEKADSYATTDTGMGWGSQFVVASIQSLISGKERKRYERFDPNDFALIVVDEGHHAVAKSYQIVLNHFKQNDELNILGVTATGDRGDGDGLSCVFDSIAYEYPLPDAVNHGWLVPIRQRSVIVPGLDFSNVGTTAGDLNKDELAAVMEFEGTLHAVAQASIESAYSLQIHSLEQFREDPDRAIKLKALAEGRKARKTLVFCASVAQADRLSEIFNRWIKDSARAVNGKTDDQIRFEMLSEYAAGVFPFLVNVGVCTEGFDVPDIELVVMGRPTKSRSLACLDAETEILTRRGWVGPDEIAANDAIATFDVTNNASAWSPILGKVDRPLRADEQMFGISSPVLDIRVSDRHDMLVRTIRGRKSQRTEWLKIKASELATNTHDFEILGSAIAKAHDQNGGLAISDDDLRFIGWFLTDGTLSKGGGITITQAEHQPWLEEIENCIKGCGFKFKRSVMLRTDCHPTESRTVKWVISKGIPRSTEKHLTGWGRLSAFIDKDFSPSLEQINRRQLGILLEAIHLGDGAKFSNQPWERRSYHISSGRKIFSDRLQSICVRRGYCCNVATHHYNKNPIYLIHIKDKRTRMVGIGKDRPQFEHMPSSVGERIWCVQTLHGTIITRRNGKVAILGNCQMIGRGTRPLDSLARILGDLPDDAARVQAIASSDKPNVEILDFVGNCGRHRLVTAIDILAGENGDATIVDRANEIAREKKVDAKEALAEAEIEIEERRAIEQMDGDAEAEQIESAEERQLIVAVNRRSAVVATTAYQVQDVGENDVVPERVQNLARGGATDPQIEFLVKLGVSRETATGYGKRQAGAVITSLKETRCTIAQASYLRRIGFSQTDIAGMNFDAAMAAINAAKAGA